MVCDWNEGNRWTNVIIVIIAALHIAQLHEWFAELIEQKIIPSMEKRKTKK